MVDHCISLYFNSIMVTGRASAMYRGWCRTGEQSVSCRKAHSPLGDRIYNSRFNAKESCNSNIEFAASTMHVTVIQ